jgi:predicted ribosome quality control (RQC) complex YloA/Tae2 family protein
VISGRDQEENEALLKYFKADDLILEAVDFGSPLTILRKAGESDIERAAQVTVAYSGGKDSAEPVRVTVKKYGGAIGEIYVLPIPREETKRWNLGFRK